MDYRADQFPVQTYECIVDMRSVYYIKEHFQELALGEFYDENRPTGKKVVDCKSEPQLILNFLEGFKPIKGTKWGKRIDNYRQSKTNPRRMTTEKMSIQGISRQIRHTLCRENQYDLDVDNCHPVLLTNWCGTKGIVCTQLDDFNNNRKLRFHQVQEILGIPKKKAKVYVLRLTNGGGITGSTNEAIIEKLKVLDWFIPLITELKTIRTHVCKAYPDLYKKSIKAKGADYYNLEGTCLSYLLTNLENQVLNIMVNACIKRNVKIGGTIYDGFQPYKENIPDLEEFMRYLESEIVTYSGYTLRISQKVMDEGFDIPEEYIDPVTRGEQEKEAEKNRTTEQKQREKDRKEQERQEKRLQRELERQEKEVQRALRKEAKKAEEEEKKTDVEYADDYLDERVGEILYDKKMGFGYFYKSATRLWCQFKSFECLDEDIIETLHLQSAREIRNINLVVKRKVMNREDDLTQFNMTTGILALSGGKVLDMVSLTVRPRIKEDLCSFYLTSTYTPDYDKEWVVQYIGQLLNTENLDYINQVLEIIGYVFTGENNLKIILVMIGKGDNGKSLFMEMIKGLLEQYSTIANPKIFKKPRFENNTHEAHLYPLIGKRGAFISELSEGDEFNATVLKRASGNDPDSIRNSGSDLTLDVTLKAVLLAVSNEVPKNTDDVLWKRLKFINFANTFARDATKESEIRSHKNDLFCAFVEGANRYYQWGRTITYCEEISSFTQNQRDSKDSFIAFSEVYEVVKTDSDRDMVSCSSVYQTYMDFCYGSKGEYKKDGKETFYKKFEAKNGLEKVLNGNKGNHYQIKPL